mgnify:CR=1 FL=1|tara:strand:+ start:2385 stop:3392 length:1008 start_codon:yes stop_codon:yes gene_type:complete
MNKFLKTSIELKEYYKNNILVNLSPPSGYRSRCEFGYKNNFYTMVSGNERIFLRRFDMPVIAIQNIMEPLLDHLKKNKILDQKLFQINFRAVKNEVLVTLIYHKELDQDWHDRAIDAANKLKVNIIGRSRKQLVATNHCELEERVEIMNPFLLYQDDKTFYQPNKYLMPKMIDFAISLIDDPQDLLELYCGCGTFTIPMSNYFRKIFATENNRKSVYYLNKAINNNKVTNIFNARISDIELNEAFNGRKFTRMKDIELKDYNFSHVLVDPPRSGLNENVVNMLNNFKNIIYISCNPITFKRDLNNLTNYKIYKMQMFDQFANTQHLELIALLTRK